MNTLGIIGKIIITESLKKQIDFYHKKIGSTEWSGILFYKTITTDFSKLENLVFEAHNLFLMDIGSQAYTEFMFNNDIIKAYNSIPDAMESNIGMIHTHHSLGAFFSGTDTKELEDNAKSYNYYISLVVDFKEEYKCKIVFPSKSTTTYMNKIKDLNGNIIEIPVIKEEIILLEGDLSIEMPVNNVDNWVEQRLIEVQEIKRKTLSKTFPIIGAHKDTFGYTPRYKQETFTFKDVIEEVTNKTEEFFIELITFGNSMNYTFKTALKDLKSLSKVDIEMLIEGLNTNITILHFNVFGSDNNYSGHINSVMKLLDKETHKNVKYLINFLKEELENEKLHEQI